MDAQKRELFEAVIRRFQRKYPTEWAKWKAVKAERVSELRNEYGSMPEGALRFSANIPEALHKQFLVIAPDYLGTVKSARAFIKEFPLFKVAEKL